MNDQQEKYADIIQKLLAKAESTHSEEEAQAFFTKAYEMMAKHSIDEAMLSAKVGGTKREPISDSIVMGRNGAGIKARRNLLAVLGRFFDCKVIMSGNRATLYVFGFPDDVEATFKLFSSLEIQMAKSLRVTGNTNASWKTNFMYAYVNRVARRLDEIKQGVRQEAETSAPGTALVLRSKDVEVAAAVNTRFGSVRKGPPAKHQFNASATSAGARAGNEAILEDRLNSGNRGSLGA